MDLRNRARELISIWRPRPNGLSEEALVAALTDAWNAALDAAAERCVFGGPIESDYMLGYDDGQQHASYSILELKKAAKQQKDD